jgi:phosphomannomutase
MVATTIVSSQLLGRMAEAAGADYRETLTGFKWIANAAIDWARAGGGDFLVGYEEALGYSVGELVRDKDGVSAAALFAELTADARARGESVADRLEAIYRRHGLYLTEQASLTLPGSEGLLRIAALMSAMRAAPPARIGPHEVLTTVDLADVSSGLPKSDVLVYRLAGDRRIIMRPSGTEPKLKSYYEVRVPVGRGEAISAAVDRARVELAALRDAHQRLLV